MAELNLRETGKYESWNLYECLKELIDATDILLHKKDYDGHGWEAKEYAWRQAKKYVEDFEKGIDSNGHI